MYIYRICKEPYHTDPLSTTGSHRHGGRWNPKGVGVLYTSRTPELALLETLVHLPPVALPELPRFWLTQIHIPDEPETVFWTRPDRLPSYWKQGTLAETQSILGEWLTVPFCLAVAVPSVILEESYNLLLHPQHPVFERVTTVSQRLLSLDSRLIR